MGRNTEWWRWLALLPVALVSLVVVVALYGSPATAAPETRFTDDFGLDQCTFTNRGQTTYFILEPGYQLNLSGQEGRTRVDLAITVLDQTRSIGGVETRVIEERHTENGALVEISRNYFAICQPSNSVIYFGEEVDIYERGQIIGHDGAWLHGVDGARAGLMMPGLPLLGARFMQEVAPGVALDQAEIIGLDGRIQTPAGTFDRCLVTEETTPLEPNARETKIYAPGVGLVQDGEVRLVSRTQAPTAGRPSALQPVSRPGPDEPTRRYFAETQHTLSGKFLAYWEANGGLALFGLPLTEEFREVNPADGQEYTVQYFERARFEHHPERQGTPAEVQLGLLGRQALVARGWLP